MAFTNGIVSVASTASITKIVSYVGVGAGILYRGLIGRIGSGKYHLIFGENGRTEKARKEKGLTVDLKIEKQAIN